MSKESVSMLIERWMNNPAFRSEIRKDPEGAIQRCGAALSTEERAAFHKIDWSLTDEQLKSKAKLFA